MRLFSLLAVLACLAIPAHAEPDEAALRAFGEERLRDAVLIYDRHFRVAETGQYLDALTIDDPRQRGTSSIAATGMGLISLAVGDALGIVPDAEAKVEVTLAHLLGEAGNESFSAQRSKSGWFRHWFDPLTGKPSGSSREKFSTIDTAILGAGAAIAGRWFREKAGDAPSKAALLAEQLVSSVDWTTAIRDTDKGTIHLVFYGKDERPTDNVATIPFDEYALLPCMAARYEHDMGRMTGATDAWRERFEKAEDLPMISYGGYTLLGKAPTQSIPSHFTHQFALYLCGAYAADETYLAEMRELMRADREWFGAREAPPHLWGLGAGSEIFDDPEKGERQRYGVSRLMKNKAVTASPAIMAGFLPVDGAEGERAILSDLHTLWEREECRYDHQGLGFLWRCPATAPEKRVTRLEGIDFSTWMLGLAAAHPKIGLRFFRDHAY